MGKVSKDTYGIRLSGASDVLSRQLWLTLRVAKAMPLRKAMGKKKKAIVDQMKPKFLAQGKANGHDPEVLEKIWGDWEKFASYAFNNVACHFAIRGLLTRLLT